MSYMPCAYEKEMTGKYVSTTHKLTIFQFTSVLDLIEVLKRMPWSLKVSKVIANDNDSTLGQLIFVETVEVSE
jgi:hypothetical protein